MPVATNHSGRTFGRITLSEPVPGKAGYWEGTCSCGRTVKKRVDNLKRPGDHSCGKCPGPAVDTDLEQRVRRLEQFVAAIKPDLLTGATPAPGRPLTSSVTSEASESVLEIRNSQFSNVTHDAEGELWEARTLSGRPFFWGATEEEAAYAARLYLERIHCTMSRRLISDAELTLPDQRRAEIRSEVNGYL